MGSCHRLSSRQDLRKGVQPYGRLLLAQKDDALEAGPQDLVQPLEEDPPGLIRPTPPQHPSLLENIPRKKPSFPTQEVMCKKGQPREKRKKTKRSSTTARAFLFDLKNESPTLKPERMLLAFGLVWSWSCIICAVLFIDTHFFISISTHTHTLIRIDMYMQQFQYVCECKFWLSAFNEFAEPSLFTCMCHPFGQFSINPVALSRRICGQRRASAALGSSSWNIAARRTCRQSTHAPPPSV